jgi:hypothetical protein
MDNLTVSFQGGLADTHRLPAYAASQSLYGISRSLLVVTNYWARAKFGIGNLTKLVRTGLRLILSLVSPAVSSLFSKFSLILRCRVWVMPSPVRWPATLRRHSSRACFRRCVGEKAEPEIEKLESNGT